MDRITDLKMGDIAIIEVIPDNTELSLLEMGFIPGAIIELIIIAPFNDPIYLIVNESHLIVRKEDIKEIKIKICV